MYVLRALRDAAKQAGAEPLMEGQALIESVVTRAVLDSVGKIGSWGETKGHRDEIQADAWNWLNERTDRYGSLRWYVGLYGVEDPADFQNVILQMRRSA